MIHGNGRQTHRSRVAFRTLDELEIYSCCKWQHDELPEERMDVGHQQEAGSERW